MLLSRSTLHLQIRMGTKSQLSLVYCLFLYSQSRLPFLNPIETVILKLKRTHTRIYVETPPMVVSTYISISVTHGHRTLTQAHPFFVSRKSCTPASYPMFLRVSFPLHTAVVRQTMDPEVICRNVCCWRNSTLRKPISQKLLQHSQLPVTKLLVRSGVTIIPD